VRNNPVNDVDPSGEIAPILILAALGFGVGFGINTWQQYQQNKGWCGFDLLSSLAWGVKGAIAASFSAITSLQIIGLMGIGLQGLGVSFGSLTLFGWGISTSALSVAGSVWLFTGQTESLKGLGHGLGQWLRNFRSWGQDRTLLTGGKNAELFVDNSGRWRNADGTFARNPNAPIPASRMAQSSLHGNDLRSPRPTWLYKLIDRSSGQVLKYGITSEPNPIDRYGISWLDRNNASLIPFAIGQRWHMHELEYIFNVMYSTPLPVHGGSYGCAQTFLHRHFAHMLWMENC